MIRFTAIFLAIALSGVLAGSAGADTVTVPGVAAGSEYTPGECSDVEREAIAGETDDLYPGWNLVAGRCETPQELIARVPSVRTIYQPGPFLDESGLWVPGAWRSYFADGPAYLNELHGSGIGYMNPTIAYWVWVAQ